MLGTTDPTADGLHQEGRLWVRLRIAGFAALLFTLLLLIGARAYRLQCREGPRLKALAEQQYLHRVALPPRRGQIDDRNGTHLAVSVEVDSVYANQRVVGSRAVAYAERLAPVLGISERVLRQRLRGKRFFSWLRRRVSSDIARRVKQLALPGIYLQKEHRRFYPNGMLAGTLLGFSGLDGHGLDGIELGLDAWLRGGPSAVVGLRDALGRSVFTEGMQDTGPARDHEVVLSLDSAIQYEAEQAVNEVRGETDPKTGWVAAVVMDPRNGDILAMATAPGFDPNRPASGEHSGARNRTITDAFEPGSTLKLFSIAAVIEEGLAREDELINCENGRWRVGRHVIHDHKPHGALSVADVLQKSSNIGVSKLAFRLGKQRLYDALKRYGFGSATGIALPGERAGVLRSPKKLSQIGLANVAFGQGVTVTMLQLARGLSMFGNGGWLPRPRLVLRIVGSEGEVVRDVPVQGEHVLSASVSRRMLAMMQRVTEPGGTAPAAALDQYTVAGKTGTAQKVDPATGTYSRDLWVSSFMGLVPASNPRLAIVVVVNDPTGRSHFGGEVAGPVFKRIATAALSYMGVRPDRESDRRDPPMLSRRSSGSAGKAKERGFTPPPPPLPRSVDVDVAGQPLAQVVVPDFRGLSMGQLLEKAAQAGVQVRIVGSGVVTDQSPSPGVATQGTVCQVSLQPPG